jgi:hypothetical protein
MVCFTELRLSRSDTHYKKYGHLGFVFDRQFVLDRFGAPVLYVRSHYNENIVGNLTQVGMLLDLIRGRAQFQIQHPTNPNVQIDVGEWIYKNLQIPISHIKAMSTPYNDDFIYLEENEWRIVHSNKLQHSGFIHITGHNQPKYKLKISHRDIQLLIVPNPIVRERIRTTNNFLDWFEGHLPPILTVNEISEF